jgi:hypothetical protein
MVPLSGDGLIVNNDRSSNRDETVIIPGLEQGFKFCLVSGGEERLIQELSGGYIHNLFVVFETILI